MSTASILWLTCCTLAGWTLGATLVRLTSSVWVRHGEKVHPAIKARMRLASLINTVIFIACGVVLRQVYAEIGAATDGTTVTDVILKALVRTLGGAIIGAMVFLPFLIGKGDDLFTLLSHKPSHSSK